MLGPKDGWKDGQMTHRLKSWPVSEVCAFTVGCTRCHGRERELLLALDVGGVRVSKVDNELCEATQ
jgi:hypothetical protein